MPKPIEPKQNPPVATGDIRTLVSFRFRRLTNMYSKAAASVYGRKFGLTLNEWRAISLIWAEGSLSTSRLSSQALFDRGMTGRIITALLKRGLVVRTANPSDGRGVMLELSDQCKALMAEVSPVAYEQNRHLLACLTQKEAEMLDTIVTKLTHQAQGMLDIERELASLGKQKEA